MQETLILPTSVKSLRSWLLNFIKNISEVSSELNIPDNKVLYAKLKGVANDLKKKELGMQHDQIVANLNRRKTLAELEVFIEQLKATPGFKDEVHGEILWLEKYTGKEEF